MNQSPTIGALAAALAKAQGEFGPAVKDSANPFFKSRYLSLAGCYAAIADAMSKNGLSVTQLTDYTERGLILTSVLMHSSGEWVSGNYLIKPVKDDPQGVGSATTYARRYTLMAIVGIAAEDDDGEAAHGRSHQSAPSPLPKPDKLKSAFNAVMAKPGMTKDVALGLAAEVCGHLVNGAADIKPEEIDAVIKCWEKQP